jgi:light-regulated signal transduction histidine kinase (bacteriophytochrome)/CheY-like chemotaxis protein
MPDQNGGQGESADAAQAPDENPCSIQPYGYLFVLDHTGATIVAVSQNLCDAIGIDPQQMVGRAINSVLIPVVPKGAGGAPNQINTQFPNQTGDVQENEANPTRSRAEHIPVQVSIQDAAHLGLWDSLAYPLKGYQIVELQPTHNSDHIAGRLYDAVLGTHRIRDSITTETTIQALVSEIKQLTGYNRVMAFRFDPDWQSEVVAEEIDAGLYSYLKHSFPADDFPVQARDLYRRGAVLVIQDVSHTPSPLLPDTGQPIDLSPTTLCNVPRALREYFGNLGGAAALSIPIVVGGRVWGLLTGHNTAPRALAQPIVRATRMLAEVASLRLAELDATVIASRLAALRSLDGAWPSHAAAAGDERDPLDAMAPALLRLAATQGIAICTGRQLWTAGQVPVRQHIASLRDWLSAHDGDGLFTNRLSDLFPAAAAFRDIASGIAARKLPTGWLLWFRPEWPHTKTWAGDLDAHAAASPQGRPTTRQSFAAWQQAIAGESQAWSHTDIAVVDQASSLIMHSFMASEARRQIAIEASIETRFQQLQSIANHLPALILYRDRDGRFDFLNRTAEQWMAVQAPDVRGKTAAEAGLADDWLRPVGVNRKREQVTATYPDGRTRTVDIAQIVDTDNVGRLRGEVVLAIDRSEQKASELRREHANKMDAIGTLTGGMAHDLNNLLGVVIGNLDLLKRLVRSDAMASELCDEAQQGAQRGAELIRRLLAFARLQALHPESVDVNALVAGSIRSLGRSLGDNIVLKLTLDPQLWPTMVDPVQLGASLQNLAINAREAMPTGGQLSIVTRNARLDADYAAQHPDVEPGPYVAIELGDTGTGMTPDIMGRIFEPFFTTKGIGKGIGLGLSMVFGFVKQSGGHLSVSSEPCLGTTFRLYLPRHGADATPSAARIDPVAVVGGHETVLLVEDNAALRQTAERQLADLGYRVRVAEHAGSALAILTDGSRVDLLFTDVVMPGPMDGIELAAQAVRIQPNLRVLLTSGFTGVRERDQRHGTGAFRLLSKPYHRDELARTVREVLDQRPRPGGAHAPTATGGTA